MLDNHTLLLPKLLPLFIYIALVVSLGGSGECLKVVNQPGSDRPSDAAAAALKEVLPRVRRHFRNAIVRGDTDFDRSDTFNTVMR